MAQIVFITANSLGPLLKHHAAIFRHGRIDNKIRLGYADKGMAKSLFRKFFSTCSSETEEKISALSDQFSASLLEDTWSMAHLQGYLLEHDEDIQSAVSEFVEWQDKQKQEAQPS
jgi:chaperone BCS1